MDTQQLPQFLIIGAMKSGTTSLYDDLKTSPFFFLPHEKEPGILVKSDTKEAAQNRYAQHFEGAGESLVKGDGSTYYTMQPLFPDVSRFAKTVCGPELKLVAILRNPIDRIISHVSHDYVAGRLAHCNVDKAIANDDRYTAFSDYVRQLKPWVETFGLDNIHVVSFQDYVTNRLTVTKEVATFLGVDSKTIVPREKISNQKASIRRPLLPESMLEVYRTYAKRLVPVAVQSIGQDLLTKKQMTMPEVEFSQALKDRLCHDFSNMELELQDVLGKVLTL